MQATPIDPVTDEEAPASFTTADETATTLSLTIDSEEFVAFGEVEPGQTVMRTEAVTVSVSGTEGTWQLTCSGEEGSDHTTSAAVGDLAFAETGTEGWTAFNIEPAPCFEQGSGNATVIHDYKLTVPEDGSIGGFQVIVTYSVEALP